MHRFYPQIKKSHLVILLSSLIIVSCQKDNKPEFNLETAKKNWDTNQHQWGKDELRTLELGHKLYILNCGGCHGSNGQGDSLIGAPALKNNSIIKGDPSAHISIVLKGKPKRSMPAYGKLLDNKSLAAIISYERNAWGNNTFNIISEKQIQQFRKQ